MRRCNHCDAGNPDTAQNCSQCRKPLQAADGQTIKLNQLDSTKPEQANSQSSPIANNPSTAVQASSNTPQTTAQTNNQTLTPEQLAQVLQHVNQVPLVPQTTAAPNQPNQTVNVNVVVQAPPTIPVPMPAPQATPATTVVMLNQNTGPGCLIRGLYFVFIGLWLGAAWTGIAWLCIASVIALPIGLMMLNSLPQVMTLKPVKQELQVRVNQNVTVIEQTKAAQHPFILRAIYFFLIGWWLSAAWLGFAWSLIAFSLGLGLPLAFWMFDRTPAITTLART